MGNGNVVPLKNARVSFAGLGAKTTAIASGDVAAVTVMDVPAVETMLETAFLDNKDSVLIGAYYVYISRVGKGKDTSYDGIADVVANYTPPVKAKAYDLLRFSRPASKVAGRNGTVVSQGPKDAVAIMSDGKLTYRLGEGGYLWRYDAPDFAGEGTKLGSHFAGADVHSLMASQSGDFVHLARPSGDYEKDAVVKFATVDYLRGH